jgi:hypothetical protein
MSCFAVCAAATPLSVVAQLTVSAVASQHAGCCRLAGLLTWCCAMWCNCEPFGLKVVGVGLEHEADLRAAVVCLWVQLARVGQTVHMPELLEVFSAVICT